MSHIWINDTFHRREICEIYTNQSFIPYEGDMSHIWINDTFNRREICEIYTNESFIPYEGDT